VSVGRGIVSAMVTADDVRRLALTLPRTEEALVHDRVKFRVKSLVYVALSRDETLMGFAYPKELRVALVAGEPDKFLMPFPSDERFNWVRVRLAALDLEEMQELVEEAWRMVVPKFLAAERLDGVLPRVRDARVTDKAWHEQHRLGSGASMEARTAWHLEHAEVCGCRPIPVSVRNAIDARRSGTGP
jgi:hypothetical protein